MQIKASRALFRMEHRELNLFVLSTLNHHIKRIEQLGTGTTFREFSRDDLCKFPILDVEANSLISKWIELQDEIANKQSVLTKEIAALTNSHATRLWLASS